MSLDEKVNSLEVAMIDSTRKLSDLEHMTETLGNKVDVVSSKVESFTSTFTTEINKLNSTLSTIVTVALNKPQGFNATEVIKLLGGIGVFILAIMYGLEQLGVLGKFFK